MNDTTSHAALPFALARNAFGRLELVRADGAHFNEVVPVRAFPIQAPDEGIALVCPDGREAAWIERLDALPPAQRQLVEEALAVREFMPRIRKIARVTSYATPSTWHVLTDRGAAAFVLRGEEDIRRIGPQMLLISDSHGIQFLVPDMLALDRASLKILDRFL
ncbi:MAG TPA: DUF1854 domain-containing protein [Noviherbaspirillum sp.]|nr:DUF1854 domain-containing protein [Noviherbaspirillum sp.]